MKKYLDLKLMKDIKDYLHLYLGCDCITDDGRHGWFGGFDVVEKDYSIVMITVRVPGSDEDWTVLNDNEECDRIKLLLRPLSGMTEDEGREVYRRYFGKDEAEDWTGDTGSAYFRPKKVKAGKYHALKIIEGEYYSSDAFMTVVNIVPYLISKGFDLFGLIEAGLAIDKTTLKQPQN